MNSDAAREVDELVRGFTRDLCRLVASAVRSQVARALATRSGPRLRRRPGAGVTIRRFRRSAGTLAAQAGQIRAFVRRTPDLRAEQIGKAMVIGTRELAPLLRRLVAAGELTRRGRARGTTYRAR